MKNTTFVVQFTRRVG